MKSKLQATALHALISALLAASVAALVYLVWFPGDYALLMKGERLFLLITAVDVALGPLLTLVAYDPKKSRRALLFDYSVIAGVQLAALVYGASVLAESRPVFTVFAVDSFELVSASEVDTDPKRNDVAGGVPRAQWLQPGWFGPQLAELRIPTGAQGHNRALDLELSGAQLSGLPAFLHPYQPPAVAAHARPVDTLLKRFPQQDAAVRRIEQRSGLPRAELRWVPAKTRFGVHTAVVDARGERVWGFLEVDPY